MTASDPHGAAPERPSASGRRGVVASERVAAREPVDSPLRRALRTTASAVSGQSTAATEPVATPRWRRPERHPEHAAPVDGPPPATPRTPLAPLEDAPILRAVLAARALAPGSSATAGSAVAAPAADEVGPSGPQTEHPAEPHPLEAQHPDAEPAAETNATALAQAVAEALPFARLAAVASPEGEPEPPLCHPAAPERRPGPLSPRRASVRHGLRRRRTPLAAAVAVASVLLVTVAAGAAALTVPRDESATTAAAPDATLQVTLSQEPPPIVSLDDPAAAQIAAVAVCDQPAVQSALGAGDPAAVIAAAGGAPAFRDAVLAGTAPCLSLGDSAWPWVVVNKQRPHAPVDFAPASVVLPEGVSSLAGGGLRPDAATALTAMVDASRAEGAGDIALSSAFRSFATQIETYDAQVSTYGAELADASSARPGHSEHQTGLAADLVACDGGCGSLDDFGASTQGQWVAANGWRFGWIVRYQPDTAPVTGYEGEPWHLRYIGPELAALYQEGGFRTLEEFWGLPAAPTY